MPMFGLRDISIKNKLVLMQVLTCIIVLGLCFAAFVITDINGYKERKVNSTVSIANVISSNSVSAIQFLDNNAAYEILRKVESDVVSATILDSKGKVFASYTRKGHSPIKLQPTYEDHYQFTDDFLYVYKDIVDSKEALGRVCLKVELSELKAIKAQKFQIATIILLIGVGLAFLIGLLNQRYISRPLLSLVKVIRQIREEQNYRTHVPVNGNDEISALSAEFNNLMDEVVRSHQKKDEFIGVASHELKTPLTSVKLYLECLARMDHEQQAKSFVLKANEGVNKLHLLILDLLDVSKLQSGQLQLNLKELTIENLVQTCVENTQMNNSGHKIMLNCGTSDTIVLADEDRLEQVINNLLANAIKYSPNEKEIYISTQPIESGIKISIQDFGIGVAKAEHSKIFERFYRATGGNSVISGFGLGLYICSQIIKRHEGKIGVNSEPGKGSTFYFEFPVVNQSKKRSIQKKSRSRHLN